MAGPLSVEDILAKQKAEKEAAAKVRLLLFGTNVHSLAWIALTRSQSS